MKKDNNAVRLAALAKKLKKCKKEDIRKAKNWGQGAAFFKRLGSKGVVNLPAKNLLTTRSEPTRSTETFEYRQYRKRTYSQW